MTCSYDNSKPHFYSPLPFPTPPLNTLLLILRLSLPRQVTVEMPAVTFDHELIPADPAATPDVLLAIAGPFFGAACGSGGLGEGSGGDARPLRPVSVAVGNPHAVFFVGNTLCTDIVGLGALLSPIDAEQHALFPAGVNVEAVEVVGERRLRERVNECSV
jgi:diaminopimelate epimerase